MRYFREINGRSLLPIVVDDKNKEKLILVDEDGLKYEFEQVWYKPYRDRTYCVLCQSKKASDGTVTKENFAFRFEKAGHDVIIALEENRRKRRAVLNDCKSSTENRAADGSRKKTEEIGPSNFKANVFANYFVNLLYSFVCIITLGLAYPPMICWKMRWLTKRTHISNLQQTFDGKALELYPRYLLWWFLSVITLGIFYIVYSGIRLRKWEVEHTHFTEDKRGKSSFDATWYQILGVTLLTGFVSVITFSLGSFWAYCYTQRWYCDHTKIDGYQLYFEGTAWEYFLRCLLWNLLSYVTFGIYGFWHVLREYQWTISMTFAEDPNDPANAILPTPLSE